MDIFNVLSLIGGLCLFLFGMNLMGEALERRAGNRLQSLLGKMTSKRLAGFATGLGVTAVIQSSSATTVMVVGFVNSGLMTLRQAINVIMGANVGTTVTSWILGLSGIGADNVFMKLLKPSSFTPVLALIGIVFYMFCKSAKKKDTGMVLLGFATLMFGMEAMSGAVKGLSSVPAFCDLFLLFENPVLGMLVGAVLTAVIQSSSASVGILQALVVTGQVTFGSAIPIIMGQNIGTCITAMLSSVGVNKNAKRAAVVHLSFNVIGTAVWLTVFSIIKYTLNPAILGESVGTWGIPVCHSLFNIACTLLLLPMAGLLEKLACRLVPDKKTEKEAKPAPILLDERLLATPAIALRQCRDMTADMAATAFRTLDESLTSVSLAASGASIGELGTSIRRGEDEGDRYEDVLGTYLVKLSEHQLEEKESAESAGLLRLIGDFERISDHGVNILESSEEMTAKNMTLTPAAMTELNVLIAAVREILRLSEDAFVKNDLRAAYRVEPLEQVIDGLKDTLRTRHILRLQRGECSIEAGFIWSDLLTNLERVSDHCSNIAGCVLDTAMGNMNLHESLRVTRTQDAEYGREYAEYAAKYQV